MRSDLRTQTRSTASSADKAGAHKHCIRKKPTHKKPIAPRIALKCPPDERPTAFYHPQDR